MRSLQREAAWFPILLALGVLIVMDVTIWLSAGLLPIALIIVSVALLGLVVILSWWRARVLVYPIGELVRSIPSETDQAGNNLSQTTEATFGIRNKSVLPEELAEVRATIEQIAEKQQRDLEARQKLERVRSEFLGNVSHELRTPIFAVQGFIETLLDGAIDDPNVNRDFLERAHVQADRLNNLLNDLIDISRIESGEMRMSFRAFDIQPFLRDFTNEMQPLGRAKNISLYFTGNVLPYHEVTVYADKERIKQVLINLVDNAIKYSESGTAIKIELLNNEPDTKQVTVRVADNGIGIALEHLPRLFERFYRVDKGRARSSPGGTGLGLAIVKHITEAHRGRISVSSDLGRGSVFQFTLRKEPF
ncbi:MAG TPA: ATP-binding protein [Candidatus Kapabacteria bacterium]|jgi:two-component system phosphate regulon sensor histidine kinase PhoR|nr:ATP-binding protein [Candidatus Kapabacteria bacterium]